jgi:hypothetical protein
MPEETSPTTETIPLPSGGSIPGIGGGALGPGTYVVDWLKRTEAAIEHMAEEMHLIPAEPVPVVKPAPAEPATEQATAPMAVVPEEPAP